MHMAPVAKSDNFNPNLLQFYVDVFFSSSSHRLCIWLSSGGDSMFQLFYLYANKLCSWIQDLTATIVCMESLLLRSFCLRPAVYALPAIISSSLNPNPIVILNVADVPNLKYSRNQS